MGRVRPRFLSLKHVALSGNRIRADGKGGAVYAVVESGGKQYRVTVGQTIDVELLGGEGAELRIGTPLVEGARVVATVDQHHRGQKLIVFKMKAKKRYRRKTGHRQELTRLTIKDIVV